MASHGNRLPLGAVPYNMVASDDTPEFSMSRERLEHLQHAANQIVRQMKAWDARDYHSIFLQEAAEERSLSGPDSELYFGGRFLNNKPIIEKTRIFQLADAAPKGAILHYHLDTSLDIEKLLDSAANPEIAHNMHITTDIRGPLTQVNARKAQVLFHFLHESKDQYRSPRSVFHRGYEGYQLDDMFVKNKGYMIFSDFLREFPNHEIHPTGSARAWLKSKLVIEPHEVTYQEGTDDGVENQRKLIDARAPMLDSLFNYEHVYSRGIYDLILDLVVQKVQYAEIRCTFKSYPSVTNAHTGAPNRDNRWILNEIQYHSSCINEALDASLAVNVKVIYCCPREYQDGILRDCMRACIQLKKDPDIGHLIVGFDMDGTELDLARLDHVPPPQLRYRDLQWFKDECKRNNVHIPLLIHCGESITDPKDSLDKALRLNPRRIAQGFALREKWDLTKDLRGRNICVETCPISDEILGFAPQAEDAIVHDLLRADVPCALGAGNRTLFGSNIAHSFYQVMVGSPDADLLTWRKLMENSLEHAVWTNSAEKQKVMDHWKMEYTSLLVRIIENEFSRSYDSPSNTVQVPFMGHADAPVPYLSGDPESDEYTTASNDSSWQDCEEEYYDEDDSRPRHAGPFPHQLQQDRRFPQESYQPMNMDGLAAAMQSTSVLDNGSYYDISQGLEWDSHQTYDPESWYIV